MFTLTYSCKFVVGVRIGSVKSKYFEKSHTDDKYCIQMVKYFVILFF